MHADCPPTAATRSTARLHGRRRGSPTRQAASMRTTARRRHTQPVPRVHQRRVRRPAPGARLEPGFRRRSPAGQRYERLAGEIDRAIAFMHACGADPEEFRAVEFYSSHEALLLDYERALTRTDSRSGRPYDLSAHLLWIGERTRASRRRPRRLRPPDPQPGRVKIGPSARARTCWPWSTGSTPTASPAGSPSSRGWARARCATRCRRWSRRWRPAAPRSPGSATRCTATPSRWPSGHKTRRFDDVVDEVHGFFEVHRELGTHPGGIHIEFTGDDVTECVGGGEHIAESDLRHPLRDRLRPPRSTAASRSTSRSSSPACTVSTPAPGAAEPSRRERAA